MGSSYVDYRGRGFWVRDYQAEVWLYLLAQEARAVADPPVWLAAARADWAMQATVGFMGCVSSLLDEHLGTEPDRVVCVLDLSDRALERLLRWSPAIPEEVDSFGTGGTESAFLGDLPTGPLVACGQAFVGLLRGELSPGVGGWAR